LLRQFPGRFLDEIDTQMDWPRYLRALAAQRIAGIEARRVNGIADPEKLTAEDREAIQEHDELLRDFDDGE